MQEEDALIEIYNESLERIDVKKRKDVDKIIDIIKCVNIFVFNDKEEIYTIDPTGSVWPDKIGGSCAGLVRRGESSLEAAHRTLKRELGIDLNLTPFKEAFYNFGDIKRLMSYFYGKTNEKIKPNKKDVKEGKWITAKEIERMIMMNELTPIFIAGFQALKNKNN